VSNKPFLTISEYHLSREKARELVLATLKRLSGKVPKVDWRRSFLDAKDGERPLRLTFQQMEQDARRTGVVQELQRILDFRDSIFGGTFESASPNHNMSVKTEYAGWVKEVQGPCRVALIERDLTEDILFYRQQTCAHSSDYGFRAMTRFYLAYLGACVSLLDAFINRHILLAKHEGFTSPEFTELKESRKLERRVELWLEVCTTRPMKKLACRTEWCHFQELRQKRNELMHAVDPFSVYRVPEIAKHLNYARTGVGELLKLLREWHDKPTLAFIERLRTAPEVTYHQLRLKNEEGAAGTTA
jgi:hypothetical protein